MDDKIVEAESLLAAGFDALPDGALITDAEGNVRALNRSASDLLGLDAATAEFLHWTEVLAHSGDPADQPPELDATGNPVEGEYRATLIRHDDAGALIDVAITVSGFAESHRGRVITIRHRSAASPLEGVLEHSRSLLSMACEGGRFGVWEWDAATGTVYESGYWLGRTQHGAKGQNLSDSELTEFLHEDDRDAVHHELVAHLKGETERFEVNVRMRGLDGGYIHFLVRGRAVERNDDGRVLRMAGVHVDVSELRRQRALLGFALESGQQGIWEWNLDTGVITEHGFWQPPLDDYDFSLPIGRSEFAQHIHADDLAEIESQVRQHLHAARDAIAVEIRLRRMDGTWGEFLIRGRAMERDDQGHVHRMVGTYTDVSEQKSQARRLQIAIENGRQGMWEWFPEQDELVFSREWYALLGYEEGLFGSLRVDLQRILHHDYIKPGYRALVSMLRGERDDFEVEHRLRHADGHYVTVLSRGRAIERGADGRATHVIGSHVDVTALKDAQQRAAESHKLLETVIDAFPQRVYWKDLDDRYLGANRRFAFDAGVETPEHLIGVRTDELPWRDTLDPARAEDRRILENGEEMVVSRRLFRPIEGREFWQESTKVPIRGPDDRIMGILGFYDDITQERQRELEMETIAQAFTDIEQSRILDALTRAAAQLAHASLAFVGRLEAGDRFEVDITSAYPLSCGLERQTYDTRTTPCERTLADGEHYALEGVGTTYPSDPHLHDLAIDGYAGQTLYGSSGEPIGIFVLMFKGPPPSLERVKTVMSIFAGRAKAELERENVHARLEASERRLNAAIAGGGQSIWEWDAGTDEFRILGGSFADEPVVSGRTMYNNLHPDDRATQARALCEFHRHPEKSFEFEARIAVGNRPQTWMLVHGQALETDDAGQVRRFLGTMTDISARKAAEEETLASRQFLELVINTVPQGVFWQDEQFHYRGCNQRFSELAGATSPSALVGLTDYDLWWRNAAKDFHRQDGRLLRGETELIYSEDAITTPDGRRGWYETLKVPMRDKRGRIIGILGAIHDVTMRKEAETTAHRLARFDPLTDLPNRRHFTERLEISLAAANRHGKRGALLFIDLDQFKQINDSLGHSVGDALLQAVAERLRNVTRQDDTVARLGGDEFVVLLSDVSVDVDVCARHAQLVAAKIHETLGEPFQFDHNQFHVTPTIGISLFPDAGKDVDDVLKEADTAMYSGKAAGRNVTRFFRREMEEAAQQRLRIEGDLRKAIVRNEFELYFQPQVDRTGDITGAEALIRWAHPERGMIPPGDFIPVAEERGLIVDIGRWVLDAAFDCYRRWADEGHVDLDELAINVSSRQFRSEAFVSDVERLLVLHRIPPHRIVFEITESTVVEDVEATIVIMERLRRVGIRFAIDDFGVGYSSLSYLKRLPLDQLKIDRSFIADIGRDSNDEIICQTIVAMSQHLRLQTIAEGVETRDQYNFLSRLRCNGYQGYLFLAPSPEDEFLQYCAERSRHMP